MTELINKILSDPAQSLLVVLNLIVIESLLAIDKAAAAGAGLPASDVLELQAMLQDYRAQHAQRLELDSRMDAKVRALLIELRHPCPAR